MESEKEEMKISFNKNTIQKIKNLLKLCPTNFSFIPFKIYKEDGNSFISIETISINGDLVFSGIISVDDISELDDNTGLIIRLPLTKAVINTIFGGSFDTVEITKQKISALQDKKKIEFSLYKIEEDELTEFPHDGISIFNLVKKMNNLEDSPYIQYNLTNENIKEIISGFSLISEANSIDIKGDKAGLNFNIEDFSGNKFEFIIETNEDIKFNSKYDINFIKLLGNTLRHKEIFETEMIFSSLIYSVTFKNEDTVATVATTALKE